MALLCFLCSLFSDGVRLGLEVLSEDEAGLDIWYSKRETTSTSMLNTVSDCFLMPMARPHSGVFLLSSLSHAWLSQLIVSCLVSTMLLFECLFPSHALAFSLIANFSSFLVTPVVSRFPGRTGSY
jgi:hypothetical protein